MTKMTNVKALAYVLENVSDLPADVREKFESMKASYEKRASKPAKPSAKQVENAGVKDAIVEWLRTVEKASIGEMLTDCPAVAGMTSQRVTALVSALTKGDEPRVERIVEKRIAYFKAI